MKDATKFPVLLRFALTCCLLLSPVGWLTANDQVALPAMVLQQKVFYDQGTNGPVASHTLLVPQGWQVEGRAFWANSQYYANVPSFQGSLRSADGLGIEIGPILNAADCRLNSQGLQLGYSRLPEFHADESGRIVIYQPTSQEDWRRFYNQKIIPHLGDHRQRVQLIEVVEVPELKALVEFLQAPLRQQLAQNNRIYAGVNVKQSYDAAGIAARIQYIENGREMEMLSLLAVSTTNTDNNLGRLIHWDVVTDLKFSAPQGQLEHHLSTMVMLASSLRETDHWTRLKNDHLRVINQITMKGMTDRSQIRLQAAADVFRIHQESYRNRMASQERMHEKYIRAIREVDVYTQGNYQYELPSGYSHVFGDGAGNFILSNDPLYHPNQDLYVPGTWTHLSPQR